jgi:outer membrane lipoprotein SlyB
MIKSILITIFATLLALSITGCSNKEVKVEEVTHNNTKASSDNDNARYQELKAKKALKELSKEFE